MKCPKCNKYDSRVLDSRLSGDGNDIRRRRECNNCGFRFTTHEYIEKSELQVEKTNGTIEDFSHSKLKNSILIACRKRPVNYELVEKMVNEIYGELSDQNSGKVKSSLIGMKVMEKLKSLDEIAYIRFASVYRKFKDLQEFMNELNSFLEKNTNA